MAKRLAGKPVVESMACDLASRVEALGRAGIAPTLALVRVGDRADDLSYERTACRRAEALGIAVKQVVLEGDASQEAIEAALAEVNENSSVHGCLMFRPLPASVDEARVCERLAPEKDIDGITMSSMASVFAGGEVGFPPATAAACLQMLDHYDISVAGKRVVVIGRSLVIGRPVAMMLLQRNATVTICHSRTENLEAVCASADIVICATGRARAFGARYFSSGQVVLDVGINFDEEGNLCGDVDFEEVEPVVSAITPVPGGIGSVTTSVTMAHVVEAAEAAVAAKVAAAAAVGSGAAGAAGAVEVTGFEAGAAEAAGAEAVREVPIA